MKARPAAQRDDGTPSLAPPLARLVRAAPGGAAVVEALRAGRWAAGPVVVKRDGARLTAMGELTTAQRLHVAVVVKRAPASPLRQLLGATPLRRQWRGARRLARAGVNVAAPLALGAGNGLETLLLERVEGEDLIQLLACAKERGWRGPAALRAAQAAVNAAALTRRIACAGLFFRDCKASNIVVDGEDRLWLVDTEGVRPAPLAGGAQRAQERMLLALLKEAVGTRLLPSRSALWRALGAAMTQGATRAQKKALWRKLAVQLRRAGDVRPRVDPRR